MLTIETYDAARPFLDRAERWLLRAEAEHSLVLGIAAGLAAAPAAPAPFLATVERDGAVAGVALRTLPHKLVLSRMPLAAVPLVAEAAEQFESLPAVLGPLDVARAFGQEWPGRRSVTPRLGMRQRIFELTHLVPPSRPAPGHARLAGPGDLDRVADWVDAFHREAGGTPSDPGEWAERHVGAGQVLL